MAKRPKRPKRAAAPKNPRPTRTKREAARTSPRRPRATPRSTPGSRHTVPLLRAMLAVSLDGYIADKAGGVGWLDPFNSPEFDFAAFIRSIGATIYGRATFDWALAHGHLTSGDGAGGKVIVLTHRPIENCPPGVEAFSGDVRELAARLKRELAGDATRETKDVWLMGGGLSITPFHEAGLVERWELAIIPVLLGDGIPLCPRREHAVESLKLVRSRAFKNGMVEAWYQGARR